MKIGHSLVIVLWENSSLGGKIIVPFTFWGVGSENTFWKFQLWTINFDQPFGVCKMVMWNLGMEAVSCVSATVC